MNAYATRLPKFFVLFLFFLSANYSKADTVDYVKGVYYVRVNTPSVDSVPLCTYSTASSILSGGGAFKRICRYSGVYRITQPFTGFGPMGMADTLSRYFRIDFSDTTLLEQFKDSLLALLYVEDVQNLPVMKTFGNFSFPNDKFASQQWALDKVKAFEAHDYSTGSGVVIAVVDDAFDMHHEDLNNSFYINTSEKNGTAGVDDDGNGYIDDISGWDASDNDGDPNNYGTTPSTMKYHGTMVTGVIAANQNNYKGITSIAPDVKIIPVKISSDSFVGNPLTHSLEGLAYAIRSPAKIINLSWGGLDIDRRANVSIMHLLITQAYNMGKIIVASAGNGRATLTTSTPCIDYGRGEATWYSIYDSIRNYPASFNEVFSIGATSSNDQKTCFSDYGTMSNIDLMAPGENIYTTYPFDNYTQMDGTSFSSPLVAGICALVWSTDTSLTRLAVTDRIKITADNISDINENIASKIGFGRVNALDAVLNNQVKAWFKVVGKQSGCEGDTFTFTTISYPGYTLEWDFGDGTSPLTGGATVNHIQANPLSADEVLFDIKLNIKNSLGVTVSTLTRPNYILISKCSTNRIVSNQNHWTFAYNAALDFNRGIAKQSPITSTLPVVVGMNSTILNKNKTGSYNYSFTNFNNQLKLNNQTSGFTDIYIDNVLSSKYLNLYTENYTESNKNFQGKFYNLDMKRTIFISSYDTNSSALNEGLRYLILRDSLSLYAYAKDLQRGYAIGGPDSADKTIDGALKIERGMAFIPRCDGKIWMIVKGKSGAYKDSLLIYLMDTVSATFSIDFQKAYFCPPLYTTDYIRTNRYGTMVVCTSEFDSSIVVFDFKRSTGQLILKHYFDLGKRIKIGPVFSEYGNILYLSHSRGLNQVNLDFKNPEEKIEDIYTDNYFTNRNGTNQPMYGIQLGSDGRIYTNFPSDMYSTNRLGMVAQPNTFFYNTYGQTKENYLANSLTLKSYSGLAVSTYHGMADYQQASECNLLPVKLFSTFVACNTVKLYTSSCNTMKKWNYVYAGYPHSRTAEEFLVYLDSFPSTGVTITMIDGVDTISQLITPQVLPPNALTASVSSTCSREALVNYKYSHSVLTSTNIFVKKWSITGGEIFRYLGDSAVDVQWNGDGVVGTLQSIIMFPLSGCSDTTLFTVPKKPPVKIKNYSLLGPWRYDSAFINYNSTFYLTIADTGYRPTYSSYKWFKDGVKLNFSDTTTRILVIEPGIYRLVADGPCGPDSSNKIVVVLTCNTLNDLSNDTLTAATYTGVKLTFDGKIDIALPHKVTFTNCTIFMKEDSWIEVSALDSLYLTNTKIIGCSRWMGIRVLGGGLPRAGGTCGYLNMTESSIENALIAVSAEAGGEVNTTGCRFTNNEMHLVYDTYSQPNNTIHINNSFGPLKPLGCGGCHPLYLVLKETNAMVYFEGVNDISFLINSFEGENTYNVSNVANIEAQSVDNVDMQDISFYNEADYGIYTKNNLNSTISGNEFNDITRYQPLIHQGAGGIKTGLYAKTCQRLMVGTANTFTCCDIGVQWYASHLNDTSRVTENEFKGCNNGLMFAQQVNPRTNTNTSLNVDTTNRRKLKIYCNLFERDSIAIVGSGKLIDHGTGGLGGVGIRNKFTDNINWDIATRNHYSYYRDPATAYFPNDALTLLKNFINLNTIPNIGFSGLSSGSSTCSNGLFVHKDESKEKAKINLPFGAMLFPNPVDKGMLTIQFTDIPLEEIKASLYNSVGQKLQTESIITKEYIMPVQHYAPGMYYIKMNSNTFGGTYKLIIK
jgi:hypothetical protein